MAAVGEMRLIIARYRGEKKREKRADEKRLCVGSADGTRNISYVVHLPCISRRAL